MLASVSFPLPESDLKAPCKPSDRESNTGIVGMKEWGEKTSPLSPMGRAVVRHERRCRAPTDGTRPDGGRRRVRPRRPAASLPGYRGRDSKGVRREWKWSPIGPTVSPAPSRLPPRLGCRCPASATVLGKEILLG